MPNQIIPVQWGKPLRKSEVNTLDKVNELVDFINNSDIHPLNLIDTDQGREVVTGTSTQLAQLEVFGESVQDGTPTPDNPVPVQVVEDIGLQIGENITPLDMQGNVLASLPNDMRDKLFVNSAGRVWIEKHVQTAELDTLSDIRFSWGNSPNAFVGYNYSLMHGINGYTTRACYCEIMTCEYTPAQIANNLAANKYAFSVGNNSYFYLNVPGVTTSELAQNWINDYKPKIYIPLATPQTIELGTITPPRIPSGSTVEIVATLQPEFALTWFTENGLPLVVDGLRGYIDTINEQINARIDELHGITRNSVVREPLTLEPIALDPFEKQINDIEEPIEESEE